MACIRIPNGIVCVADVADHFVEVSGRRWHFDFSEWGGPLWLNANGTDRKNQEPPRAVWDAFDSWMHLYDTRDQRGWGKYWQSDRLHSTERRTR